MKTCKDCQQNLAQDLFPSNKNTKDRLSYYCKRCCVKRTMASRKREKIIDLESGKTIYKRKYTKYTVNSKEYHRNIVLIHKYNITLEEYNKMLFKQDNKCAICERHLNELPKTFDVDHCHTTGKVRGLLCGKCNMGIGYFQDNSLIIEKALTYIKSYKV